MQEENSVPHADITIRKAQQLVDDWIRTYGVRYFTELTNMAVLTEEVGELARVISRKYGDQSFKPGEPQDPADEMADVLWVLLCLANQTGVDLTEALQRNLDKKTTRDKERHKNNPKIPAKAANEVRVLAIDIAMKAGKENDNTIFHVIFGTLEDYGYQRNFVYTESYNGKATSLQALRIKQLFYEYDIDYIVLDTLNAGISVYDELTKETIDNETGERYAPMMVLNDEKLLVINDTTLNDLRNRVVNRTGALAVIFPMQANLQLNSIMSIDFKKQLEQKKVWLCADEQNQMDLLMQTNKTFRDGDKADREFYLRPFIEHSELVKECVNLSMSLNNGYIKLQEPKDGYKDRFVSANYGSYFYSLLERKNIKQNNSYGLEAYQEAFGSSTRQINRTRYNKRPKGFKFL